MRQIINKVKPKRGFSHIVHILLTLFLPLLLYVLVRIDFAQVAIALVLLSKWRMFSVKARHWPANIRANAVDIIVGLSVVLFMDKTNSQSIQFLWVGLYTFWLTYIKPKSSSLWVGAQAMVGQALGLMALYTVYGTSTIAVLTLASTFICYFAARHFFSSFDETMGRTSAYVWAYFASSITWLLAHWLIFYNIIPMPVLIISVVGYTMAALYYLKHTDRLTAPLRRQFIIILVAILVFLIVFSEWSDKAIS